MTEIQIFQLFGLTFFAIGIGMLGNPKFIKNITQELDKSTVGMMYGGLISLAIGYFIVAFHGAWGGGWSFFITIMGWLAIFKGLGLLMHPVGMLNMYKKIISKKSHAIVISWIIIIIGLLSLYFGYIA